MAIKKSELYSSLWKSCDVLRGGMDASQYKDYVLVMLFLRYVSDKAEADPAALIQVPERCKFEAIGALKGQKDIGEKMDVIIGELAKENNLQGIIDQVSFNDEERLGKGKDMQDRLSALVGTFEDPNQFPQGIAAVYVNGTLAVDAQGLRDKRAGQVLMRSD